MTRKCFDSITAKDIPAGSELVAGYIDGIYRWTDADWALFPDRIKVRIAVLASTNDGEVLDVEPGDATPTMAVDWVRMRRAAGVDPTIYCGIGDWTAVQEAFRSLGEPQPHYWIAHYDGVIKIPDGAIAKQWGNPLFTGGHYDISVVADYWPGVDKEEAMDQDTFNRMFDARLAESPEYVNTTLAIKGALAKVAGDLKDTEYKAVVEALLDIKPEALKPQP